MAHDDEIFRTIAELSPAELAAFDAVVRYGGFRSAARATGASASALSHAVAGLERRLAKQLLLRSTRSVSTTDAGRQFLIMLRPALRQLSAAVSDINAADGEPSGLIRINASPVAVEQVMSSVIVPFMKYAPRVRVDIHGDGGLIDVAEGGFDCGIRCRDLVSDDCVAIPIGEPEQQHIVVGSADYLRKAPPLAIPSDLVKHQCIQFRLSSDNVYRWEFTKNGESFTVGTNGSLVVDSTRLAMLAALGGLGLAYVMRSLAAQALASSRLVQVLSDWTPPYPGLALYYHRHQYMNPPMQAFVKFLKGRKS